jgi:undecaprenyl-diphosphatase
VLWIGERYGEKKQHLVDLTLVQAIVIGIAQTLALIPGTSRVGITLTAALLLGLTSQAAATFSFLLSIPVIILAGGYEVRMLILTGSEMDPVQMLLAMVVAFVSSLLVIHLFLKALTRIGLLPFVIYRLVLGVVLLWIFLPPYLSTLMP